jgi:hypothetical protein
MEKRRGVMTPPDRGATRGLMSVDPRTGSERVAPVEPKTFLWTIAGILAATLYVAHAVVTA